MAAPPTQIGRSRMSRRAPPHPLLTLFVALLALLQALAATPPTRAAEHWGASEAGAGPAAAPHCDGHGDGGAPTPDRCASSLCCILCQPRGGAVPDTSAPPRGVVVMAPPVAVVRLARGRFDAVPCAPKARRGAWSSRAPPSFS